MTPAMAIPTTDRAWSEPIRDALDRGVQNLLRLQAKGGYWKAELESNVCMESEDLLMRRFLRIDDDSIIQPTARWIRSQQLRDGAWSLFYGGDGDLSATIEAYTALRLAGDAKDAGHMRRATAWIRERGGIAKSRVFTRIWLALFGEWSWDALPALPPEVILLPSWCPLNIYDFACWARQTIVPLTIVAAHRPSRPLGFDLNELHLPRVAEANHPISSWAGLFQRIDRVLHGYDRHPFASLRRHALAVAAEWVLKRQEADGSWGGIQPPWVYSIMALHLLGYPLDHPAMAKALQGLETFAIVTGETRRLEACQSPVWDTALTMVALRDAGVAYDHPAMRSGAAWLLREEVRVRGDWAVRRPDLPPGGWAFEFQNDNYPDLDDAAEVVMALRATQHRAAGADDPASAAIGRALDWVYGMQCRDGGWAAFDVDNSSRLPSELPFCDFGEVTDPPSSDVSAHVIEMLAEEGHHRDPRFEQAVGWLLDQQEAWGSWFGRWGANHLYGTGAAVPALIRAGIDPAHAAIRRAVAWLESCQNDDGGWGEDLRSYDDAALAGRGESCASQTAWALLALIDAGGAPEATRRGIDWLVEQQRSDGGWDEEQFTGTGFPGDFYIRYHLYAQNFPVMALGRFLRTHS